jgi:hypothetical protein
MLALKINDERTADNLPGNACCTLLIAAAFAGPNTSPDSRPPGA